jgi:hypothetical protein
MLKLCVLLVMVAWLLYLPLSGTWKHLSQPTGETFLGYRRNQDQIVYWKKMNARLRRPGGGSEMGGIGMSPLMMYVLVCMPSVMQMGAYLDMPASWVVGAIRSPFDRQMQKDVGFSIRVLEDNGKVLPGAEVVLTLGMDEPRREQRRITDAAGLAHFAFSPNEIAFLRVEKEGYFSTCASNGLDNYYPVFGLGKWLSEEFARTPGRTLDLELISNKPGRDRSPIFFSFPVKSAEDQTFGVDLVMGAPLPPLGNGRYHDATFHIRRDPKWQGRGTRMELNITFEGEGNGVQPWLEPPNLPGVRFRFQSQHDYPLEAPEDGYISQLPIPTGERSRGESRYPHVYFIRLRCESPADTRYGWFDPSDQNYTVHLDDRHPRFKWNYKIYSGRSFFMDPP